MGHGGNVAPFTGLGSALRTAGYDVTDEPPGQSILIGDVPHDWLFPRMAALVHHAGAGTTAAGLRAGVPAIGLPMIGDQPFWAARPAALAIGPRPILLRRLTAPALAAAHRDATTRPSYLNRARDLAARIAGEDGTRPVAQASAACPADHAASGHNPDRVSARTPDSRAAPSVS